MATVRNVITPTMDVFEAEPTPQTPWPDVQPLPTRVPMPTRMPPRNRRQGVDLGHPECHAGDVVELSGRPGLVERTRHQARLESQREHRCAEDDTEREDDSPVTRGDVPLEPGLVGDVRQRRLEEGTRPAAIPVLR